MRVAAAHACAGKEETAAEVARHIWHCAANSVWLGAFFVCDWDMFSTAAWHSEIRW